MDRIESKNRRESRILFNEIKSVFELFGCIQIA